MDNFDKACYCTKRMKAYFEVVDERAIVPVPESIEINSLEYVTYLFYSCLLDYGMRSKIYHTNLMETYKKYPMIFKPSYVTDNYLNNTESLLEIIKDNIHPRYPNIALKKWLELSEFLSKKYPNQSLITKIVSLSSYKELYNFITSIKGYGQKTGGLLLRLIYESGIGSFNDELSDIPIDRHDIEISYLNGVVTSDKLNNKEIKELGELWIKAASKYGVSPCHIDKYLWTIGNSFCLKKKCLECPLKDNCQRKI